MQPQSFRRTELCNDEVVDAFQRLGLGWLLIISRTSRLGEWQSSIQIQVWLIARTRSEIEETNCKVPTTITSCRGIDEARYWCRQLRFSLKLWHDAGGRLWESVAITGDIAL